jgi:hypothetical protein
MTAGAINSVRSELLDTADRVGDSFWTEFPTILGETTDTIRVLDDDISSLSIGALESMPGIMRESSRAADELIPEFTDIGAPLFDLFGSLSRLGTGTFDLGSNVLLRPLFDGLAAASPVLDLVGDGLHVMGEALGFVYDNIGKENISAFAGSIKTAVDLAYIFGETLYNVGDALGVWGGLAEGIRRVGDGLGFVYDMAGAAYDKVAGGAEWALGKLISLHNKLNDVPGVAMTSSFVAKEDLSMPDFSGGPGEGANGESGTPPGIPSPGQTGVQSTAIASLPSMGGGTGTTAGGGSTSSTTAGTGTATAATAQPLSSAGGGKTINNNQTFQNEFNFYGVESLDSPRDANRTFRRARKRLNREQAKMSGPGN